MRTRLALQGAKVQCCRGMAMESVDLKVYPCKSINSKSMLVSLLSRHIGPVYPLVGIILPILGRSLQF